jgi:kynurenine formamidase
MGKIKLVDLSHPFGEQGPIWPAGEDWHTKKVQ